MTSLRTTSTIALIATALGLCALSIATPAAANEKGGEFLNGADMGHGPVVPKGSRGPRLHCDVFGASCSGDRDRDRGHDRDYGRRYHWERYGYGWGYPWSYGYYNSYSSYFPRSYVEVSPGRACSVHMHYSPRYSRCIDNYD